jgi:Transcriptional regulator, AbiEi antitoxin/Protein of unknown function (DUF559)
MPDVPDFDAAIRTQPPERERSMAAIAERQHGVVSHFQLRRLGFSASAIRRLVASGRLHVLHRGVYAVGHRALPANGSTMAAALAGGPGALVAHRSAAAVRGLLHDSRPVVDILVAGSRRDRRGMVFHESRLIHPDDRSEVDGIPVTSVARTLLDIAEVVPRRKLVYALEQAERLRVFDLREVEALMARSRGRHGLKVLTAAIREIEPEAQHVRSRMERLFVAFCSRYELEVPAMNVSVEGFTVDALWAKRKLIVELDSWTHHNERRAFEEDRRRDAILKLAGYGVLRVTYRWLTEEPDDLALTIRRLSASRSLAATA